MKIITDDNESIHVPSGRVANIIKWLALRCEELERSGDDSGGLMIDWRGRSVSLQVKKVYRIQ